MNPRITKKERGLIKGAVRRVFSRSDLRRIAVAKTIVTNYQDASRPRVKTWCFCSACNRHWAKSEMEVDHIDPVVPSHLTLEDMSWDDVVDRIWCPESNLKAICKACHKLKTKREAKERAIHRRRRK